MKKVGILGGSFDPIHFGHINLAMSLMESCTLDEVLFIPTRLSPFKEGTPPTASAEARLTMLQIALDSAPGCRILDWEMQGQGSAYTIDTVRKLSKDPSLKLHLLIGEDHLNALHRWKDFQELLRLAPPLIGARVTEALLSNFTEVLGLAKVKIPLFDISSTTIRQRLAEGKYCGHLVPASVLSYIQQHHLYRYG